MPEFTVEVAFDVYCSCGEALCNQSVTQDYAGGYRNRARSVTVEPCPKCLDRAEGAGYDTGFKEGEESND